MRLRRKKRKKENRPNISGKKISFIYRPSAALISKCIGIGQRKTHIGRPLTRSTEPLNHRFSIPVLVYPRSAYFACHSLLTHQLVRSEILAWTVLWLTWSVVEKCNLEQISCLLKLLHGPYRVHSSLLPEQGKSVSLLNILCSCGSVVRALR